MVDENSMWIERNGGRKKNITPGMLADSTCSKWPIDLLKVGEKLIFKGCDKERKALNYAARNTSAHRMDWKFSVTNWNGMTIVVRRK